MSHPVSYYFANCLIFSHLVFFNWNYNTFTLLTIISNFRSLKPSTIALDSISQSRKSSQAFESVDIITVLERILDELWLSNLKTSMDFDSDQCRFIQIRLESHKYLFDSQIATEFNREQKREPCAILRRWHKLLWKNM